MQTTATQSAVGHATFDGTRVGPQPLRARVLLPWRSGVPSPLDTIRRAGQRLRIRRSEPGTRRLPHAQIRLSMDQNYRYRVPSSVYLAPSVWHRMSCDPQVHRAR